MIYVYAPSMASIIYALKNTQFEKLIIISSNNSIIEFCQNYNVEHIAFRQNNVKSFKALIKYKSYLNNLFKFDQKTISFHFYGFDYWGLYLMHRLKHNNTIKFHNLDHIYPELSTFETIKLNRQKVKDLLIIRFLTKLNLKYFKIAEDRHFLGLSPIELSKNFEDLGYTNEKIFNNNKSYFLRELNMPEPLGIFIDQGCERFELPNEIVDVLKLYFSTKELFIKEHPTFKLSNENFRYFNSIPREIPIDLLISDNILLISISSTSIVSNNPNNKKISLINLVKWKDNSEKLNYIKLIPPDVIIPNSIEELQQYLS